MTNVAVASGVFTVQLDFGACPTCFDGAARFLEISVRVAGGGAFTPLAPRQPITSTPYSIKTSNLTFNAPFDDGGGTVFAASNTFAGEGTAASTTPSPILNNSLGKFNAFFGAGAGQQTTDGSLNAFFGAQTGEHNGNGCCNAFFGYQAGQLGIGTDNAYFGFQAGRNNVFGTENAFFGNGAGFSAIGGTANTFIGTFADFNTSNSGGNFNTLLGFGATLNSGLNNATAIGFRALVSQSNSLVLGSINGINGAPADTNVGIGTTAPSERLHIVGNGLFTGNLTASGALTATQFNIVSPALGSSIRLVGISGTGDTNTFLGRNAAAANPTGSFNSFFGNGSHIERQQQQLEALKSLVCSTHRKAKVCK